VLQHDGALQATWGGSPIRDAASGRYHLFFSWFETPDNSTVASTKWWSEKVDAAQDNSIFAEFSLGGGSMLHCWQLISSITTPAAVQKR
jgi:hypothetical protein